jgi:hypothetical protein
MRKGLVIFALGAAAAAVAGCASMGAYTVPRDAAATSDMVDAAGDTSASRSHSADVEGPHGCIGPLPVNGPGLNGCPGGAPRR